MQKHQPHVSYESLLCTFEDGQQIIMPSVLVDVIQYIRKNPESSTSEITQLGLISGHTLRKQLLYLCNMKILSSKRTFRQCLYTVSNKLFSYVGIPRVYGRKPYTRKTDATKGMGRFYRLISLGGTNLFLVTSSCLGVLEALWNNPGASDEGLQEYLGIDRLPMVQELVCALVENGLVTVKKVGSEYVNFLSKPFLIIDHIPIHNFSCPSYVPRKDGRIAKAKGA